MKTAISDLEPQKLWENFESICNIPHPSKHEEKIIEFVKSIGESSGLETTVDKVGNVIIRKPATTGYEALKVTTLQSHLDMVPQKNSGIDHDFTKDPIKPYIDGEWITAENTTLGADNGIGVATILSILQSNEIEHGPLEALFTIDEETGMTGAFNLEPGILNGEILLNLDSEDEGELYIGCAGGVSTHAAFHFETADLHDGYNCYQLHLCGFKGGHSGVDIHLERGNSNIEMARILFELINKFDAEVISFNGGDLRNAIPREAKSLIAIPESHEKEFINEIMLLEQRLKNELAVNAKGINLKFKQIDCEKPAIAKLIIKTVLRAIISCPNGVLRRNIEIPEVVELSSNLGIINTFDDKIEIHTLQRGSIDTLRELAAEQVRHVFELAGAQVSHSGEYPGWSPNPHSPILEKMKNIYLNMYGEEAKVRVIHAGLECGIIHAGHQKMDMISFGPTIRFPHSPDEKVHIASVRKFWDYTLEVLKNIPNQ